MTSFYSTIQPLTLCKVSNTLSQALPIAVTRALLEGYPYSLPIIGRMQCDLESEWSINFDITSSYRCTIVLFILRVFAFLQKPKVADVVVRSHASKASYLWLGSRAHLRGLEAFGFLIVKYAFPHSRDPFCLISDIYIDTRNF